MATMEDAITAYIAYLKKEAGLGKKSVDERCGHNAAYQRSTEVEIRVLKDTPRDPKVVARLLERKRVMLGQAEKLEEDRLMSEITALEWLNMILNGTEEKWRGWALLSKG